MNATTNRVADNPTFAALLESAVNDPGQLHNGYTAFWNYSLGNVLLAWSQCMERGIQPGPLATFQSWKDKGRFVRRGEKAIVLCQPVTVKREGTDEGEEEIAFTRFVYRPRWFAISQTDGADFRAQAVPGWDRDRALRVLGIEESAFTVLDGNCQGFARGRSIAVSPVAVYPLKTTFHEAAHVLLGHTEQADLNDDERTPRNLREAEAEAVAMVCCGALNLPGIESARAYIQNWWGKGNPIPEASARAILKTADAILRAGRKTAEAGE